MSLTPYFEDSHTTLYQGDVLEVLRELPAGSVHTCVTSPPYWGLRHYGIEGQLGHEPTPAEYVAKMVEVFREVRRALRDDGTLWLNLGDSYANTGGMTGGTNGKDGGVARMARMFAGGYRALSDGLKPKDLVGIPWRVAFAIQADGWYLRSDIIWAKPNPMPESVTDRPTKSHEYLFLLSKKARYYYDSDAVRESAEYGRREWKGDNMAAVGVDGYRASASVTGGDPTTGRNRRSVWTIATQPFSGEHYAAYPEALVEPCILAGTSERGVCSECGAPWERVVDAIRESSIGRGGQPWTALTGQRDSKGGLPKSWFSTTGWRPTCKNEAPAIPATVLDPFMGSGTTALVARKAGRRCIGIDLNPEYLALARDRIAQGVLL